MTEATLALDLDAVNAMEQSDFVAALGRTFEHSPWVTERAWASRPFASLDALHAAMMGVVRGAPRGTQVAFLCGHPELAGKEAQAGTMTRESVGEQASAGLNALSQDEMGELRELNARYRERHGFPFIVAVRRHSKAEIFRLLRSRLAQDSELELNEALAQIAYITRLRVEARVAA
ncbi:MAG TPA: 2-oxo-4-hydroxy-4-carboxy-5-ureidoimidazoline decarboxylase [Polaromonas sp.]|jgi:2-oxo-4-hydroxy-4-carboxy-5-ureidoimidazoline decarboxylase|nr:2-oxo-4-hydroxy-4-carboxy-5-ureidoimidazoline decarboxylase [Ideonella sp.]